jgi:hypothetical protein
MRSTAHATAAPRRFVPTLALLFALLAAGCGELNPLFPGADAASKPETPSGERFTLVAIPDTQGIVASYPEMFYAQLDWIRNHAAALNIKYVVHEGDITNDSTDEEWWTADRGFRLLDERVPYALTLGNHDYPGGAGVESRDTSGFDARFPPSRMEKQLGFVAMLDPNSAVNAAYKFWGNGQTWLVFALEFGPRDHVLSWVAEILAANPSATAILVTHAYLFVDGTRFDAANRTDQYSNPHDYDLDGRLEGVNDAEEMWQKLIAHQRQIRFVLCGHMHAQAGLTSARLGAPPVYQLLADYQHESYGGYGYLRLMTFEPDGRVIVQTYSPFLDRYRNEQENDFVLGP